MALTISAVIIYGGKYDQKLLGLAKKSVSWCDELVLINGVKGSFNDWRNEGFKKAKSDWVLYLDSDEEITVNLQEEIDLIINGEDLTNNAYAIPRRNYIFNKEFKYSGQYPDYQKRLFLRKSLKKWSGEVHEEPIFEGSMGHLKNPMIHHKKMTLSEMIDKTNKWSEIEAKLMFEANHPSMNIFRFASAAFREFIKRFLNEKAFLDGKEGIIYGIYQIYSKLISYSKLWEKQLQSTIRI
ncbi:glycosyltransferase family 2 protein [Candidatus Dojkabacteria bacterium]|nr:glycosyltransferase family 2 protein [Candidatus Dojkabacteria bacterium]